MSLGKATKRFKSIMKKSFLHFYY